MPAPERATGQSAGHQAIRWVLSRTSRVTGAVAVVLALSAFVVEVAFRRPPAPPAGTPPLLRLGLSVPTRLAHVLFGNSQAAYLLVAMLAGVALAVGVYLLGVLALDSRAVGVAAAAVTVGNSVVFPTLTRPSAELLATALLCWAVALCVALRQGRRIVTATRGRQIVVLAAVGVLVGWSYLTYEWAIFGWLLVALLLRRRQPVVDLIWVGVPALLLVTIETGYAAAAYGDPLARLHGVLSSRPATNPSEPGRLPGGISAVDVIGGVPDGLWLAIMLAVTVVAAVAARRLGFLLAWVASIALPTLALGAVLDPGTPLRQVQDGSQWIPLVPAVALGAAGGVWLLVRNALLRSLRARAGLVAAAVTLGCAAVPVGLAEHARASGGTATDRSYAATGGNHLENFRDWLAQHAGGVGVLWADRSSIDMVRMFTMGTFGGDFWDGDLHAWRPGVGQPKPAPGDYVVLYSPRSDICQPCRDNARALLGSRVNVPAAWQPAYLDRAGDIEVYQVR